MFRNQRIVPSNQARERVKGYHRISSSMKRVEGARANHFRRHVIRRRPWHKRCSAIILPEQFLGGPNSAALRKLEAAREVPRKHNVPSGFSCLDSARCRLP